MVDGRLIAARWLDAKRRASHDTAALVGACVLLVGVVGTAVAVLPPGDDVAVVVAIAAGFCGVCARSVRQAAFDPLTANELRVLAQFVPHLHDHTIRHLGARLVARSRLVTGDLWICAQLEHSLRSRLEPRRDTGVGVVIRYDRKGVAGALLALADQSDRSIRPAK